MTRAWTLRQREAHDGGSLSKQKGTRTDRNPNLMAQIQGQDHVELHGVVKNVIYVVSNPDKKKKMASNSGHGVVVVLIVEGKNAKVVVHASGHQKALVKGSHATVNTFEKEWSIVPRTGQRLVLGAWVQNIDNQLVNIHKATDTPQGDSPDVYSTDLMDNSSKEEDMVEMSILEGMVNVIVRDGLGEDVPWVLDGDFNIILLVEERIGGVSSYGNGSWLFVDFITGCRFLDLGYTGPPFT
ncbi:hypothetical protein V6N11_067310 [Hibiscus sabdariffa]|uniref:Uncharacterized protein n=1 Tax=Hibiscus sabdariffa TaxID=183260 RepID=A0ABR2SQD7_9ROSI